MALILRQLTRPLDEREDDFLARVGRMLAARGCPPRSLRPYRRSIDARPGRPLAFVYHVEVEVQDERRLRSRFRGMTAAADDERVEEPRPGKTPLEGRVLVVGAGPAGLYAAHCLAAAGYRPLLCEQGLPLGDRVAAVRRFFRDRILDPDGNLLFGEGGAGTYSDGKLLTRTSRPGVRAWYRLLVRCGAQEDILIDAQPHIGTDRLRAVVEGMRARILAAGGEMRFRCRVDGLKVEEGRLLAVRAGGEWIAAGAVAWAPGQHADETYDLVARAGGCIEPRPYQLGVRIEHDQEAVDRWRYGAHAGHPALPPASYQITWHAREERLRGVTTFCMCPGGEVVPIAPCQGRLGTNGMSYSFRRRRFANSALITTLEAPGASYEEVLAFRARLEARVFEAGGGDWSAPAQRAADFTAGMSSAAIPAASSYRLGLRAAPVAELLPPAAGASIGAALAHFDTLLRGFATGDAVLIGVESRVSSPLRIRRTAAGESAGIAGLYPCGEGAGYASGITSSALDGKRAADAIIARFAPPP
ncbi:MAG TPA: hypothetical protein DCM87_00135 [Planctomycetes bacterium]|nr:hypothetical protein [Planctomycetota bacterium]